MNNQTSPLDTARNLYLQSADRCDDLSRAYWLVTPEVWARIRAEANSYCFVETTGPREQTMFGIALRFAPQGQQPAIDLIVEP